MSACILCFGHELRPMLRKNGYAVVRCGGCGLTQLDPMPSQDDLDALYEGDYFSGENGAGYSDYSGQEAEYRATFAEEIRRFEPFLPGRRILDAGCGFGYFMAVAEEAGFEAYGVDLSAEAADRCRLRFGDRAMRGTLQEARAWGLESFDAVFASHLIEHLPRPRAFMEEARALLKPGGLLILVTPNVSSLLARISGPRWVSYKIPEHVAYYNPVTIRRLAGDGGFETVRIESAHQYYQAPFVARRLRELVHPAGRLAPPVEKLPWVRDRIIRVTSGSLRLIARRR